MAPCLPGSTVGGHLDVSCCAEILILVTHEYRWLVTIDRVTWRSARAGLPGAGVILSRLG